MFLDLIKLYNKNNNKTPLEDFNTECFANILSLFENVKIDFILTFLKLPIDNYQIKTQLKKNLPNTTNCIIDLVFIGKNNVCFFESKIESSEGYEQLKRYSEVLDFHYKEKNKFLYYCTKYTEKKNENGAFNRYNFKQFRWHEIAKFLNGYKVDNPLIKEYLIFLNHYKMSQDNTFRIENLLSMENMIKTIEIVEFHINNCSFEFETVFKSVKKDKNFNWGQLKEHNRFSNYKNGILVSATNKYSEILYSIEFEDLSLNSQIYVNHDHEQIEKFQMIDLTDTQLKCRIENWGTAIYMKEDLVKFLNNVDSDKLIKDWYCNSFEVFKKLIISNNQIEWQK